MTLFPRGSLHTATEGWEAKKICMWVQATLSQLTSFINIVIALAPKINSEFKFKPGGIKKSKALRYSGIQDCWKTSSFGNVSNKSQWKTVKKNIGKSSMKMCWQFDINCWYIYIYSTMLLKWISLNIPIFLLCSNIIFFPKVIFYIPTHYFLWRVSWQWSGNPICSVRYAITTTGNGQ